MALIFADFILYSVLLGILTSVPGFDELINENIFATLIVSELIFIFPALPLYMLITRQKFSDILPLNPMGWKNAAYILLMTFLLGPVTALLSALTSLFYPNAAEQITSMFTLENLPAAVFAAAVLPALAEEICFRGAALNASKGMSVITAAVINGILFGLMHMNPQQIPYATFLGIVFSLYVIHTRSIFSSMLAHFLVNAPNVVLALTLADNAGTAEATEVTLSAISTLAVSAAVFFLMFLNVYKRFRSYNLCRNPPDYPGGNTQ
jgi:membrane protease YdiL (CAAX protease family)